jgi:hypothetical protein
MNLVYKNDTVTVELAEGQLCIPDTEVNIHLTSGDVVTVTSEGIIEFWGGQGKTLQLRSQWTGTGLEVLPYK